MEEKHGGDWAGFEAEYGCLPLDFSMSVSPLGLPPLAVEAAKNAVAQSDRYPDPECRRLRRALSRFHGCKQEQILCGGGAADLIWRLVMALRPKQALLPVPTFSEYEQALSAAESQISYHCLPEETDFAMTEGILDQITPAADLLILCEPNNPTGRTTDPRLLRRILDACCASGTVLLVDECFSGFLPEREAQSMLKLVDDHPNLVVLRAFTKGYAMAGLRLGYCICEDVGLLRRMSRAGPPWNASIPAQEAGIAALSDPEYLTRLGNLMQAERPRLQKALETLGCRVIPGQANFLLLFHPHRSLAQALRRKGILIRDCANFRGLSPGWYRVAVRTAPENDRLIEAMKEVLSWQNPL